MPARIVMPQLFAALLLICALGLGTTTSAQPVVVSEYYNDNPPQEWTEIIVIQDNIDLRGWVVTDNNASQTARQGGVRFRNIPSWQHVRAGTIIGIWHRDYISASPQDFDTSMADGRIMLAKNDTRFFEPYAAPDVQFPDAPMNLAQEGDIMEILDANDNHIHGLGHRSTPGSYWLAMPEPKLNTASALNNGQSNRVYPGSALSQYNGPHGAPLSEACAVNISRTLPNRSCSSSASNWEFWHSLRRPSWNSPQLVATVNSNAVVLSWNPMLDPYPQDGLSGYLVVRDSTGREFIPEQGRIYRDGERIGSALILAHLPSTATSYTDPIALMCGVTYTYRVFAFRFGQDDEYGAYPSPQSTRGRQYNTVSFGSVAALKQVERGPSLRTDGSPTTFCEGNAITLSVQNIPAGYTAQWLRNGAAITGATGPTYQATTSGEYRLRLQRPDGCFVLSDSVIVTVHPAPTAAIFPQSLVQLCQDSSVVLQAMFNEQWRYQWYRDGDPISGATAATYVATQAGSYSVIVSNEFGCSARSQPTTVEILQLQIVLSQQQIVFAPLSGCESVREVSVTLRNQSRFPIELRKAIEPPHFFVVSPSLPSQLNVGEEKVITLRFAPSVSGTWSDSIGIELEPCGRIRWIRVQGSKTGVAGTLSTQSPLKDVGIITRCNGTISPKTDTITITASGDLTVDRIQIGAPFRLAAGFTTPFSMQAGETKPIPIEFAPALDQPYSRDLTISYTSAQCRDSLVIPLRGALTTPFIALSTRDITFPTLDSCTTIFTDTTITLYNTSLVPVEIEQLPDEQLQIVQPIPAPTLQIPPRDSIKIRIRYSPNGYTAMQQRLTVLFGDERCTQSEVLVVRGMRIGSNVSLSATTVEFPPLLRCRDTGQVRQTLQLSITSIPSNAAGVQIVSVSSTADWLLCSLTAGPLSDGTHPFSVTIDPTRLSPGPQSGTISIRIEPCSRILTVSVNTTVDDLNIGFEDTPLRDTVIIDLGLVQVGATQTHNIQLTNNSTYDVAFASPGLLSPWISISASYLPGVLPAQSSEPLLLTVNPTQEGPLDDTIRIIAASPCSRTLVIIVHGRAIRDTIRSAPVYFEVHIPEDHTAFPGDLVRYTIRLVGINGQLALPKLIIPIIFDESLLFVERVTAGEALLEGTISGSHVPNYGYRVDFGQPVIVKSGAIAHLDCRVLLSSAMETFLIPDSRRIFTGDTNIRISGLRTGWLRLGERCNIRERFVQLGKATQMVILQDASDFILELDQGSNAHTRITAYDLSGRAILPIFDGHLERGHHSFTVPRSVLPTGAFIVQYTCEDIHRSILLINQ